MWTSYAAHARWGICLARTDPEAGKHRGISYLVVDMSDPGVEVRPLRQITGEVEFNEVFLDDVWVPADHLVGGLNQGWAVANTTLAHERGTNFPFKEQVVHEVFLQRAGRSWPTPGAHWTTRRSPTRWWTPRSGLCGCCGCTTGGPSPRSPRGRSPVPESSWIKLAWTEMTQGLSSAALEVLGDDAPLWGPWQRQWLWSRAAPIAGGTSEIQRTIIGERLLGLPR